MPGVTILADIRTPGPHKILSDRQHVIAYTVVWRGVPARSALSLASSLVLLHYLHRGERGLSVVRRGLACAARDRRRPRPRP